MLERPGLQSGDLAAKFIQFGDELRLVSGLVVHDPAFPQAVSPR